MQFFDDSLLPENQEKLVIQAAPYGPEWLPTDSEDIPVSMDEQVQKAVDFQPHFMIGSIHQLETVERLIRKGISARHMSDCAEGNFSLLCTNGGT